MASELSINGRFTVALIVAVGCAGLTACSMRGPMMSNSFQPQHPPAVAPKANSKDCRVVSFKRDVLPALQESCLACHYDKRQAPGLDLSASNAYTDIVNRKSRLDPNLVLIKPSSVASSFLVEKLSPKPRYGATMPPYARPLTPAEKNLLAEWIEQGAKDN